MMNFAVMHRSKLDRQNKLVRAWEAFEQECLAQGPPGTTDFFRFTYGNADGRTASFVGWRTTNGAWLNTKSSTERFSASSWNQIVEFLGMYDRLPIKLEVWSDQGKQTFHFSKQ